MAPGTNGGRLGRHADSVTTSLTSDNRAQGGGPGDGYSGRFVWRIENFTRLKDLLKKRKITALCIKSRHFQIGNRDCRLIVYPRGGLADLLHCELPCAQLASAGRQCKFQTARSAVRGSQKRNHCLPATGGAQVSIALCPILC